MEPKPVPQKAVKAEPTTPPPVAVAKPSEPATPVVAAVVIEEGPAPAATAEAEMAAEEAEAEPTRKRWLDGYYTGWGSSRHGDIQAFVRIEDNRIVDAGVASCETRWPCDVIERIIRQPIEIQSAEVDRVSRATESADAYYYGLVTALEHAQNGVFKSVRP